MIQVAWRLWPLDNVGKGKAQALRDAELAIVKGLSQRCTDMRERELCLLPWCLARMGAGRFHYGSHDLLAELAEDGGLLGFPGKEVTMVGGNVRTSTHANESQMHISCQLSGSKAMSYFAFENNLPCLAHF